MQILNSKQDATKKVPSYRFVESRQLTNNFKHIFALKILHQQKNVFFIVESFDETDNIRKYCFLQDIFLFYYTVFHLFLPYCFLRQAFYSVELSTGLFVFDQKYLAKLALA